MKKSYFEAFEQIELTLAFLGTKSYKTLHILDMETRESLLLWLYKLIDTNELDYMEAQPDLLCCSPLLKASFRMTRFY